MYKRKKCIKIKHLKILSHSVSDTYYSVSWQLQDRMSLIKNLHTLKRNRKLYILINATAKK